MQDASQFAMSHGLYNLNVGSEILILAGDIMSRSWPNIGGTKYCQEIHFGQKIALLLVDRKQPDSKSNQADFATTQPTVRQCVRCTLWHSRLWSFQGRDTKLERFLAKNQLYSNEISKF